jgi:hypothetical protein
VQARVDAGRGARAGDQIAVVDEQHIAVDPGGRIHPRQFRCVRPVSGAVPAVEQARGTCDERSGADGQDRRAGLGRCPKGRQRFRRVGVGSVCGLRRGHRHQIRAREPVEAVLRNHLDTD